jgi:hypothetical protein
MRSTAGKRPNGSATTSVENCSPAASRENRSPRARNSRVGASPTPRLQARQMPYSGRGGAGRSEEGVKHGSRNEDHGADRGRVGQEPPTGWRRHHRQRTVYTRLLAEGVDVPPGAMARILEDLSAEGQITGPQAIDREDKQLPGARAIIEPEWRL